MLIDPGFGRVFTDHMAIIEYDRSRAGTLRASLRASLSRWILRPPFSITPGDIRGHEGLSPSERRSGSVPARCQRAALRKIGHSDGDATAARGDVPGFGAGARASRPRMDSRSRGRIALPAAFHDRERLVPRNAAVHAVYLCGNRVVGGRLLQERFAERLAVGDARIRPRCARRDWGSQVRRQLCRQPRRAGGSDPQGLRPGRVS